MSCSAYARPVPKPEPNVRDLSYDMRNVLALHYTNNDGSVFGGVELTLDQRDLPFFAGVEAAAQDADLLEDARYIIKTIREHGGVIVWGEA